MDLRNSAILDSPASTLTAECNRKGCEFGISIELAATRGGEKKDFYRAYLAHLRAHEQEELRDVRAQLGRFGWFLTILAGLSMTRLRTRRVST